MPSQPQNPSFDPTGAVRFDLRSGTASDAAGARLVLVPSDVIDALDDGAVAQIGRAVGRACGARLAARFGGEDGVRATELEVIVTHLAGELALAGVGVLSIERWGRALVAVVSNASVASGTFFVAVLSSALSDATGREVIAAPLGDEGPRSRYFLGSPATAHRVRALVAEGRNHASIVAILQGSAS
jgi:hypothetical protein